MELNQIQKEAYEVGKRLAAEFEGYSRQMAQRLAPAWFYEATEKLRENNTFEFYMAGFHGIEPEWVEAYRYGEIPESGLSTNWATGESEHGVSCVAIIGERNENAKTVYDTIYGLQGIQKIKIAGWNLGFTGSDGEPLLSGAVRV